MKKLLKSVVSRAVRHDAFWRPFRVLSGVAMFGTRQRALALFRRHFPGDLVRRGPFANMRIPGEEFARGSALIPKYLGTYEAELNQVIEECIHHNPAIVVDVGSAEGYYAVGFAMRCPGAKVFAFDTNPEVRIACEKTAEANGVTDRLSVHGPCCSADLLAMDLPAGSLVISDCEGYELELFSEDVVRHLSGCYVLIEVHDCYRPEISSMLRRRFAETHDLQVIRSSLDKSDHWDALEHPDFSQAIKNSLCFEREFNMDWFYFSPRRLGV